jgi:hypothetical protein
VRARLQTITRKRVGVWEALTRSFRPKPTDPLFVGHVSRARFKIHRDIRYGNSFLPIIRGRVFAGTPGETVVTITMALPVFPAAFMLVWFAGVTFVTAATIPEFLASGNPIALGAFAMLGGGVALVWFAFYPEARKAERILRQALE